MHVERARDQTTPQPGVFWLNGLRSSMRGEKAEALARWCVDNCHDCIRFDYRGHGVSPGRFEDCTIGDWLADARAVFAAHARGPQIVVGSSMGGWLAALLAEEFRADPPEKAWIAGLILIAPAIDMTERLMWQAMPEPVRAQLLETGVFNRPSRYGDGDYPITRALIEEGRDHLFGDRPFDPGCPVHIIHGARDPDVPLRVSEDFCANLACADVRLTVIPDGEHRLSRPQDIAVLLSAVATMAAQVSASPDALSASSPSRQVG